MTSENEGGFDYFGWYSAAESIGERLVYSCILKTPDLTLHGKISSTRLYIPLFDPQDADAEFNSKSLNLGDVSMDVICEKIGLVFGETYPSKSILDFKVDSSGYLHTWGLAIFARGKGMTLSIQDFVENFSTTFPLLRLLPRRE